MANICTTWYHIESENKEDLQQVYNLFNNLWENRFQLHNPSEWGPLWLGHIVEQFGKDVMDCNCSGEISGVEMMCISRGDIFISIVVESKWSDCHDVFELIKEKFPSLKIYWQAEEFGCLYFCTNDKEGHEFEDVYYLCGEGIESKYFTKGQEQEILDFIYDEYGIIYDNIEEAVRYGKNEPFYLIVCEYVKDSLLD